LTKFLEPFSKKERHRIVDQLCLKYPTWFFEVLTQVEGKPFVLEPYQIDYLLDESDFKIINKTRQAGASLIVAAEKFWKAYRNEYYRCDIVSVNQREAQGKIAYIRALWESLPARWRHPLSVDNQLAIGFHSGARRSLINSIAPSAGVRGGKKDIVFDEAAHVLNFDTCYVAALPATVRGKGAMTVVSTPLGQRGRFWEIWSNKDGNYNDWSRHFFSWFDVSFFCTNPTAARHAWENEYQENWAFMPELLERFGTDRLKQFARVMTQEEFEQEFCGRFVDETTAFFPWELILRCQRNDEPQGDGDRDYITRWDARPKGNENPVYIGIDFAEGRPGGDSTSIQIVEEDPSGVLIHRQWYDLDYRSGYNDFDKQIAFIGDVIDRFKPQRVSVDATALGIKIARDLVNIHGSLIEPINFTTFSKEEMALNLKALLEREKLLLQKNNSRLAGQIHNMKRIITPHGNIKFNGHPHDDMFWALALACRGQSKRGFRIITVFD